ncbi:MAG: hypothetical protein ACI8W8_002933 [Rhodothermales bacterium]|jgi:hypothetical protein
MIRFVLFSLSLIAFSSWGAGFLPTDGTRGRIENPDLHDQEFDIRTMKGVGRVAWDGNTTLSTKKMSHDLTALSSRGQDATIILGPGWKAELKEGRVKASRGYIYSGRGNMKPALPTLESGRITGVLSRTNDSGTQAELVVDQHKFQVEISERPSFVFIFPTVPEAGFRNTDDVRIFGELVGSTFVANKLEFYSGDWKKPVVEKREAPPKPEATQGLAHREKPDSIRHKPVASTGTGFSKDLSESFRVLPQPAQVKQNTELFDQFLPPEMRGRNNDNWGHNGSTRFRRSSQDDEYDRRREERAAEVRAREAAVRERARAAQAGGVE